jgi:hypothetical protein
MPALARLRVRHKQLRSVCCVLVPHRWARLQVELRIDQYLARHKLMTQLCDAARLLFLLLLLLQFLLALQQLVQELCQAVHCSCCCCSASRLSQCQQQTLSLFAAQSHPVLQ